MKDKNTLKTTVLVSQLLTVVQNQSHILLENGVVTVEQFLATSSTSAFGNYLLRTKHVIACAAKTLICGHRDL